MGHWGIGGRLVGGPSGGDLSAMRGNCGVTKEHLVFQQREKKELGGKDEQFRENGFDFKIPFTHNSNANYYIPILLLQIVID